MQGRELRAKEFIDPVEVMQISFGVRLRGWCAICPGIDRGEIVTPAGVRDVDDAIAGVQYAMSAIAAGEDAVEHVHTSADALNDVGGGANAHEVARLIFWQNITAQLADAIHVFNGFADREAADSVARLVLAGDELARLRSQVIVAAALYDGEKRLRMAVLRCGIFHELHTPFEPTVGEVHAVLGVLALGRVGRAFIEGHHNVGADASLNTEATLRAEQVPGTIDVAGEGCAFLGDLTPMGEAEHLVAAAVG